MTSQSGGQPGRTNELEVLTLGQAGVDVYPQQLDVRLERVATFRKYLGGAAANVAVAAAALGRSAAIISSVGDDPLGRFVARTLRELGVSDAYVVTNPSCSTQVNFCEILPPDEFGVWTYWNPASDDLQLTGGGIGLDAVSAAKVLWMSADGFYEQAARTSHFAALEARAGRAFTVLDLDGRSLPRAGGADTGEHLRAALSQVTVVVGTADSCTAFVGEGDLDRAADALLAGGVDLAVVKEDGRRVVAKTRSGQHAESSAVPTLPTLNRLGASDAFAGSLCHGLLAGWPLEELLGRATAASAIAASRLECSTVMPTELEIDALLDGCDPNSLLIDAWASRTAGASR